MTLKLTKDIPQDLRVEPQTAEERENAQTCAFKPAFRPPPSNELSVGVFGAGIAGLTAAHELAKRGFDVTVYEEAQDPRQNLKDWGRPGSELQGSNEWRRVAPGVPVQFGGLAASQYSDPPDAKATENTRLFNPQDQTGAEKLPAPLVGEHGFRFFPAYYMHLFDLLQQIPVYDLDRNRTPIGPKAELQGEFAKIRRTSRTVYDNVVRTVTQGMTTPDGAPSVIIPRESPRSLAEFLSTLYAMKHTRYAPADVMTFTGRVMRYMVTTPERRWSEYENVSAYEFLVGKRGKDEPNDYYYEPQFLKQIRQMPRVLAAYDSQYGDARTIMTTWIQLNLLLDRRDAKGDGVLNGPTTEAWFDHWYLYLTRELGVKFKPASLKEFEFRYARPNGDFENPTTEAEAAWKAIRDVKPYPAGSATFLTLKPEEYRFGLRVNHGLGGLIASVEEYESDTKKAAEPQYHDYYVLATSAHAAHEVTKEIQVDSAASLQRLKNFVTRRPNEKGPRYKRGSGYRKNKYDLEEIGVQPWDRFQTLSGIQFFFEVPLQIVRGHIYYNESPWALSSICQQVHWEERPTLARDGYATVMSVDIGDWTKPVNLKELDGEWSARDLLMCQPRVVQLANDFDVDEQDLLAVVKAGRTEASPGTKREKIMAAVRPEAHNRAEAAAEARLAALTAAAAARLDALRNDGDKGSLADAEAEQEALKIAKEAEDERLPTEVERLATAACMVLERPELQGLNVLAREVWRQITAELDLHYKGSAEDVLPEPKWFTLDKHIDLKIDKEGEKPENLAPYLVPIVGDFKHRPSAHPFNPRGTTGVWVRKPGPLGEERDSWQAPHGGYEVHHGCLVTAGTWTKTFTRITSMEAACESGRHAVHAILDHLLELDHQADYREQKEKEYELIGRPVPQSVWDEYEPRKHDPLQWRSPYDWLDQTFSAPTRQPTSRGDYCLIVDPEDREDAEYRPARQLDLGFYRNGRPHPWRSSGVDLMASHVSYKGAYGGPYEMFPLMGTYAPVGLLTDTLKAQADLWSESNA